MSASPRRKILGITGVAAIAALSISNPRPPPTNDASVEEPRELAAFDLVAADAKYTLLTETGQLVIASNYGRTRYELDITIGIDGVERPLKFKKGGVVPRDQPAPSLSAAFSVELGDGRADATLDLGVDPATSSLSIAVTIQPKKRDKLRPVSLRLSSSSGSTVLFVLEHGELKDLGEVETRAVVLDDDVHPVAITTRDARTFTFGQNAPEIETPGAKPRFTTAIELASDPEKPLRADAAILLGNSSDVFWGALFGLLHVPTARVTGTIEGTTGRAEVFALDEAGHPLLRVPTSAGHFVVDAPRTAVRWYATIESAQTSTAVTDYDPGSGKDLRLKMLPGGELHVRVLDSDTGLPVLARIAVRGIDGAIDPKFRHDFRAAGAGPLVDSRSGEIKTTLPAGRYRVSALKGIEWSIDSEIVDMASGGGKTVELRPRHVVPTPALVGCDLHVHARPSFDSNVAPEDRLLSLASAGIDFAVPTEHNMVGDYTSFIDRVDLRGQIAHVTGVEVTTSVPGIGHYGVFPYPNNTPVPPHNKTKIDAVFAASKRDPKSVLVVHHPRLPGGLGYFEVSGFDPKSEKIPSGMRTDFDLVEVYSGYEITRRAKTETVIRDWFALLDMGKRYPATGSSDSHKLQFHWAGYPRTYVRIDDPALAGEIGGAPNPAAVVGAVKRGEGFITSGPILDFDISGVRPGGDLDMTTWNSDGRKVPAHLRIRAAPWIDVTSIDVIANSVSIFKATIPTQKTVTGDEHGSFEEATARALRYDADITLTIPPNAKWVVVIVRGERAYDDVLPFMPVQPLAFTNPIWLK